MSQPVKYIDSMFKQSGLDEIINEDSHSQSDLQFSVKLPMIPKQFAHLIKNFNVDEVEKKYRTQNQICDCCKDNEQPLLECPHFHDPSFAALYSQLPQRLALLEQCNSESKEEIRMNLFNQIMATLEKLPCSGDISSTTVQIANESHQNFPMIENHQHDQCDLIDITNKNAINSLEISKKKKKNTKYQPKVLTNELQTKKMQLPKEPCHIYRDLKKWFPEEYDKYFELGKYQPKVEDIEAQKLKEEKQNNKCYKFFHPKATDLAINLSFGSNILLLLLKIVCFAISKSMSILSSMIDSATDILCGLVIFIAVRTAKKGIQKGEYQQFLHSANTCGDKNKQFKVFYARRFESLGQLSFSWIMACLSVVLIYEAIKKIIDYAKGAEEEIDFSAIPMAIIVFTIVLKFCLSVFCYTVAKKNSQSRDVVLSYAQDHRNDVLSNTIGLIGASLCFYLKGQWKYADPVASIILSLYIFINWVTNAIEAMKNLAGSQVDQQEADDLLLRIFQFTSTIYIVAVEQLNCYYSGTMIIVEMRIRLPDNLSLPASHQIVQEMQNEYEKLEKVERCYVHVECESAVNIL